MAETDATTDAIDRIGDFVDRVQDTLSRAFSTAKRVEEKNRPRATGFVVQDAPVATSIVVPRFKMIEATDAETGRALWIVSNGADKAECSSRDFAEQVRRALEALP